MISKQTVRDWGKVLSSDSFLDPKSFILATLIPSADLVLNKGNMKSNSLVINISDLRKLTKEADKAIALLVKGNLAIKNNDKLIIGYAGFFSGTTFLPEIEEAGNSKLNYSTKRADTKPLQIPDTVDRLLNSYLIYCKSIRRVVQGETAKKEVLSILDMLMI